VGNVKRERQSINLAAGTGDGWLKRFQRSGGGRGVTREQDAISVEKTLCAEGAFGKTLEDLIQGSPGRRALRCSSMREK